MNEKILSLQDIEQLDEELAHFNSYIVEYYTLVNTAINQFDNTPVVQSLYESGNFGQSQKEYMISIKKALEKYIAAISQPGGLVSQTKEYISTQRDLLMMASRGYTATDSIRARREGNQG